MKTNNISWSDVLKEIKKLKEENERLKDEIVSKDIHIGLLEQKCILLENKIPTKDNHKVLVKTKGSNYYTGL